MASQCGDQRDRDRSGLTLWQVSVETNETETEGEKQDPALFFQEAGPEVSIQAANRKETIVKSECGMLDARRPHISSIRLNMSTLRLRLGSLRRRDSVCSITQYCVSL